MLNDVNLKTPVFGSDPYHNEGISLFVNFYLTHPKNDFEVKKVNGKAVTVFKSEHHKWPNTKDIDNMIKFVMDAMQGIMYVNDACICSIICNKHFVTLNTDENIPNAAVPYTTIVLKQKYLLDPVTSSVEERNKHK
jgi:hypothetical protein